MSIRVAVITPASMNRLDHLQRQRRFLTEVRTPGIEVVRVEAWLDVDAPVSYTHLTLPTNREV